MKRIGASHTQHSAERARNMKRAARAPARLRTSQGGRPCKPAKILPPIRRKDLPAVHLPRCGGGGTASPSDLQRGRHPPEDSRADRSRPHSRSASPCHHHQCRREPNQTTRSTSAQAFRRIRPAREERDQSHVAAWAGATAKSSGRAPGTSRPPWRKTPDPAVAAQEPTTPRPRCPSSLRADRSDRTGKEIGNL